MLIDVHAHFYHARTPRADWRERNESRLAAGSKIGISVHVASILGSFGFTSPTYFPSPRDVTAGNDALLALQRAHSDRIRGYVCVNPNYTAHARAQRRVPVLQHIWQHRRGDRPGQEASDAGELCTLARRHPDVAFILAHIGGGGDWLHSLHAVADVPNVYVDLSGSGVDGGMVEACLASAGVNRLLWGSDITMDTGWAKLRFLETLLSKDELALVRWKNAARIFPAGAFPAD